MSGANVCLRNSCTNELPELAHRSTRFCSPECYRLNRGEKQREEIMCPNRPWDFESAVKVLSSSWSQI